MQLARLTAAASLLPMSTAAASRASAPAMTSALALITLPKIAVTYATSSSWAAAILPIALALPAVRSRAALTASGMSMIALRRLSAGADAPLWRG